MKLEDLKAANFSKNLKKVAVYLARNSFVRKVPQSFMPSKWINKYKMISYFFSEYYGC